MFRDFVEGQQGGGNSGEDVDYLLFRDVAEGPDVVLQGDGGEGVDGGVTVESEWITFCSGTV